jgi:ABC-type transport system involved in cytochrome bd biosynthesis fused ATPase/permease subunit
VCEHILTRPFAIFAGKSNLINAVLGRMSLVGGSARVGGSVAYVPQKPWCQFGTLRDNVLFGQPWDEHK